MVLVVVLCFAIVVSLIYEVLPMVRKKYNEAQANKNISVESQEIFKKTKRNLIITAVAIAGAIVLSISCFVILLDNSSDSSSSSSTRKGKCAWCGTETSGGMCSSCSDAAFGKDGWYDKIKDQN